MAVLDTFTDFNFYYSLDTPAVSSGEIIEANLMNITKTIGLETYGYIRPDYKDLRVAYNHPSTGWEDIDRSIHENSVYFAAQATDATPQSGKYAVYFGCTQDDTLSAPEDVGSPDAFDNSSFNTNLWYSTKSAGATLSETTSLLVSTPTANDYAVWGAKGAMVEGRSVTVRGKIPSTTTSYFYLMQITQAATDPAGWSSSDFINTTINANRRCGVMSYYTGTKYLLNVFHSDVDGTIQYWNNATKAWVTSPTTFDLNTGGSWSDEIESTFEFTDNYCRWTVKNITTGVTYLDRERIRLYDDSSGSYYNLQGDVFSNYYAYSGTFTLGAAGVVGGTKTKPGKTQRAWDTDTIALMQSNSTNDAKVSCFGCDQTVGKQMGIQFTMSSEDHIARIEILGRQESAGNEVEGDMFCYLYEDNGSGFPGEFMGRGVGYAYGIEKYTESFQWVPFYFPAHPKLPAGDYVAVFEVNGYCVEGTTDVEWASDSVASGGTLIKRTRAAGSWGSWSSDSTKIPCHKIYTGHPKTAQDRITFGSRESTNPVLEATGIPTWEGYWNADIAEHLAIYDCMWDDVGEEYRVVYSSYTWDSSPPGIIYRDLGVGHGDDLLSLSKYDQFPLFYRASGVTEHATPKIYDWTQSDMKMILRAKYGTMTDGMMRHLRYATNTHSTWYQNETGGGWDDQGIITYPWPLCDNVLGNVVFVVDSTIYVAASYNYDNTNFGHESRVMIGEFDESGLELSNGRGIYLDYTDMDVGNAFNFVGGIYKTEDDWYHCVITEQYTVVGEDGGDYAFRVWICSSQDFYNFASPDLLMDREESAPREGQGPDGAGIILPDGKFLYTGINRYWIGTPPDYDDPVIDVVANLAYLTLKTEDGGFFLHPTLHPLNNQVRGGFI